MTLTLMLGAMEAIGATVLTNAVASQRAGTKLADIYYDLVSDATSVTIAVQVSADGGVTYGVPASSCSGDVGAGVQPGTRKHVVWNGGADWNERVCNEMRVKVVVTYSEQPPVVTGSFVLVPAGSFSLGDALGDEASLEGSVSNPVYFETPAHTVALSPFSIETTAVTEGQWREVRAWGASHGYTDLESGFETVINDGLGSGHQKGDAYPINNVDWYNVLKWCNARSEQDGLAPCYTVSGSPFRTGSSDWVVCDWNASGYRLPTEAEWEKAARGGLSGKRFPWGDTIDRTHANYYVDSVGGTNAYSFDLGTPNGWDPRYQTGGMEAIPYTCPVGSFPANGYGLYDVTGNVSQWCWNAFEYYESGASSDPTGPLGPYMRPARGGSWNDVATCQRVSFRLNVDASGRNCGIGFRCARSAPGLIRGPALNITSPLDGVTVSGMRVTVSGNASDNGLGNSGISSVTVNGVAAIGGSATGSGTANWSAVIGLVVGSNPITVVATDGSNNTTHLSISVTYTAPVVTGSFVEIPPGSFSMGDNLDGESDAPVRTASVSGVSMETTLVTESQWSGVKAWGASHGYTDLALGSGADGLGHSKGAAYPVVNVSWYDVVKWCNARSEQDGLTPCYTLSGSTYRTGASGAVVCALRASGYRVPTEAEWEKAARGGLSGKRFPWGDLIDRSHANYSVYMVSGTNYYPYDLGTPSGYDPVNLTGNEPYTSPVGSFPVNGYGLYDIAGNVWEWCGDWYGNYGSGTLTDPAGPASGSYRVLRGGNWDNNANGSRVACRGYNDPATNYDSGGFRCVRSIADVTGPAVSIRFPANGTVKTGWPFLVGGFASDNGRGDNGIWSITVNGVKANGSASATGTAQWTANVYPLYGSNTITVVATDGSNNSTQTSISVTYAPPVVTGSLVLIPTGSFSMGNAFGDGSSDELPGHTVSVSAFSIESTLVTQSQWTMVHDWGLSHGYTDLELGSADDGEANANPAYPEVNVAWYDVVKWCNARSEQEGLTPCYTVSGSTYRVGTSDAVVCNWNASGYRLPTEAEWEKAARGGLSGRRFPWGDTIDRKYANYYVDSVNGTNAYTYDLGTPGGADPKYSTMTYEPYTSPVGSYLANGYGLSDMAGNANEWCWDWYGSYGSGVVSDPTGPTSGGQNNARILRGGDWSSSARFARVSSRISDDPAIADLTYGFRCVRR